MVAYHVEALLGLGGWCGVDELLHALVRALATLFPQVRHFTNSSLATLCALLLAQLLHLLVELAVVIFVLSQLEGLDALVLDQQPVFDLQMDIGILVNH